jgi:hypothetical protein
VTLADGGRLPSTMMPEPPDLSGFVASLSSAWRAGEVRPTFSVEAKPRYLRSLQAVVQPDVAPMPKSAAMQATVTQSLAQTPPAISPKPASERPQLIYAEPGKPVYHAFTMIWPLVCRRLEGFPNITSAQLFDELCVQFPGRFHPKHVNRLAKLLKQWRQDARSRGVVIARPIYRRFSSKPRGRPRPKSCTAHWAEMLQWLEEHPDQTAVEVLTEFQARYPGFYDRSHLRTLRRRLQVWRREAIQRLICKMQDHTQDVSSAATA